MEITLTLTWWLIPTLISFISIGWALFIYKDKSGYLSGLGNIILLVPALGISLVAWIIGAIVK